MSHRLVASLLLLAAAAPLPAQSAASPPPIRPLGPVVRVSAAGLLGSVSSVRPLPGGRLVVNDIARRRAILLDSLLAESVVIADSTPATANAYAGRAAGLISYRGDSTLFIEPQSLAMLVIAPDGTVARVMAIPRPNDAPFMVGGPFGTPGFDPAGRIVYRGIARPALPAAPTGAATGPIVPQQPDSAPLLRVELATRRLDTVAFFKVPRPTMNVAQDERGGMKITLLQNPIPVVDDWALLDDGTVAIVRGTEYKVEFIAPDGTRRMAPKVPFDWQRLSDDDKQRLVDSTRTALAAARAAAPAGAPPAPSAGGGSGGGQVMMFRLEGGPAGGGAPPRGAAPTIAPPTMDVVPASELADYRPAFGPGATRVDPEGNLWVRTTRAAAGGPVYDVIGRDGRLRDRVQLPKGRVIAGFGTGVVYLGVRDEAGARLEIARVR